MDIGELTLNQIREIQSITTPLAEHQAGSSFIGKEVLVRTYSAGVHIGKLVSKCGQNATIEDAQRIWSWSGAFTLSEVSQEGITGGRIACRVPLIELDQVIEVMQTTQKARDSYKEHEDAA